MWSTWIYGSRSNAVSTSFLHWRDFLTKTAVKTSTSTTHKTSFAVFSRSLQLPTCLRPQCAAVCWLTAGYYLHNCHMPQCWNIFWVVCWNILDLLSLHTVFFFTTTSFLPITLSHTHTLCFLFPSISNIHKYNIVQQRSFGTLTICPHTCWRFELQSCLNSCSDDAAAAAVRFKTDFKTKNLLTLLTTQQSKILLCFQSLIQKEKKNYWKAVMLQYVGNPKAAAQNCSTTHRGTQAGIDCYSAEHWLICFGCRWFSENLIL